MRVQKDALDAQRREKERKKRKRKCKLKRKGKRKGKERKKGCPKQTGQLLEMREMHV